uniref:FGF1 intracellular binding protein n=1 Tax=Vombatus ursinus TaxID=29139 RepID=A0A4X2JUK2_VOMUR
MCTGSGWTDTRVRAGERWEPPPPGGGGGRGGGGAGAGVGAGRPSARPHGPLSSSVNDAVGLRVRSGILEQTGATAGVLQSDTMDHYRTFHMLERLLHTPPKLLHQLVFQIPPSRQALLIERYYTFDEAFVREVLGKKLSKGTKKDLDDISTKTGVTLKSCRRQFDNFKRVFKVVEEMRGSLAGNIQQHFLLSDRLARDYAAVVFFANNRFETGKKKLQYLTFGDLAFCAELMIQNWTPGAVDSQVDDMDVDLDKEFLQDLKELKVLVADKDLLDLHKSLVCTALRGKLSIFPEMEANFKNLSRGLVNIASKLTHTKDVRDLFVDLVEKVGIPPCPGTAPTCPSLSHGAPLCLLLSSHPVCQL